MAAISFWIDVAPILVLLAAPLYVGIPLLLLISVIRDARATRRPPRRSPLIEQRAAHQNLYPLPRRHVTVSPRKRPRSHR